MLRASRTFCLSSLCFSDGRFNLFAILFLFSVEVAVVVYNGFRNVFILFVCGKRITADMADL